VKHETDDRNIESILEGLCYENEEGHKTYYISQSTEKILLKKDDWLSRLAHFKLHPPLKLADSAWGVTAENAALYKKSPPAEIEPNHDTKKWKVLDGRLNKNFIAQLRASLGDNLTASKFFRVACKEDKCDKNAGDCSSDAVFVTKNNEALQLIINKLVTVKNLIKNKKEKEQIGGIIEKFRTISETADKVKWYEKNAVPDGFSFAIIGGLIALIVRYLIKRGGPRGGGSAESHNNSGQAPESGLENPRLYEAKVWQPPPREKPLEKDWLVYTVEFFPAAAFSAAGLVRSGIGLALEEFAGELTFDGLAASAATVFAF
ncbi:MAG: hypothetical protein HYY43_05600, partial [Deltaproteobacteria bacterium]|nr:hypothetical protein [Deltaproteobacteria bacterium]